MKKPKMCIQMSTQLSIKQCISTYYKKFGNEGT
jgi:hypothetical protein